MSNKLQGGLFDGRGTPRPLALRKSAQTIVIPESDIQKSFFAFIRLHTRQNPILDSVFAVPNGLWARNEAVAIDMVKQGMTAGIQDVMCLAPSACGKYHGLLIEFKTLAKSSRQSEEQKFFQKFFADLGYRTEVFRAWEDAADCVIDHLNLPIRKVMRRG